jgi:hypothetical protein
LSDPSRAHRRLNVLERELAEARTQYLDDPARREPAAWREVGGLIGTKRPNDHDRADTLLVDPRDLADTSGRAPDAEGRIREIRRRHGNKPGLPKRLDQEQLGK